MDAEDKQGIIDAEQLRLLSFFHYVSGGVTIAFSLMLLVHLSFMVFIVSNPEFHQQQDPSNISGASEVFAVFSYVFGALLCFGLVYGICELISGTYIKRRTHRVFSLVVAIPRILFLPYGTLLSIFTLMLLDRDSIKALYGK